MSELLRSASHAQLAAYLEQHHELLAPLLPADTSCDDLFNEVGADGSLGDFFDASEDPAVGRELKRLGHRVKAWLIEETSKSKAKEKRDKVNAQRRAAQEREAKKQKVLHGSPPKPPTMSFTDAQVVAGQVVAKREENARKRLLEKGWTGLFRSPGSGSPTHQAWFCEDPKAACKVMGTEYHGLDFGQFRVHFPGTVLETFESIKRATKTKVSGKGAFKIVTPIPYANWTLPTVGPVLSWQEFFSFVGHYYKTTGAAEIQLLMNNSAERIGEMGEALASEMGKKYDVKIERASKDIAKEDQRAAEARDGRVKYQIEEQVATLKRIRNALIDERVAEVENIQRKYDAFKETRLIKEAQAQAKKAKADNAHAALFTRSTPAGGATSVDGAAAIAAIVTGKSVADSAAAELTCGPGDGCCAHRPCAAAGVAGRGCDGGGAGGGARCGLCGLLSIGGTHCTAMHRAGLSAHHRPCTGMHSSTF